MLATSLAAGCGSGGGDGATDSESTSSSSSSSSETFDTPDPEPTTSETSSSSSGNDNPSISVARLPVGGDSEDNESDPTIQCAHVTWIASDQGQIPKGTAVEITKVIFDPPVFEVVSEGCGTSPPNCAGYIFRTSTLACDLAVRVEGTVPNAARPTVGFSGLVYCPSNTSESCKRFVAALGDELQISVVLNTPPPPLPPITTDTGTGTATTSDGG